MKILHVSQSIQGGPASYFDEIAHVQTAEFGKENVRFLIPEAHLHFLERVPPETIRVFRPYSRSPLALARLFFAILREIRDFQPDILHLHSTYAGGLGRIAHTLLPQGSRRVVYCAHSWAFWRPLPRFIAGGIAFLERILAPATDAYIHVSESDREMAESYGLTSVTSHVVLNGIRDLSTILPAPEPLPAGKVHYVFLGRLDRQKGFNILSQAVSGLSKKSVHFHIIGGTVLDRKNPDWEGDPGQVTFYGWLPRNRALNLLNACDVLLMPSQWEGLPISGVEALCLGKPILGSDIPTIREVVGDGEAGLLFPANDAAALKALLESTPIEQWQTFGARARKRYVTHFQAKDMNGRLVELYRRLAAETDPEPV